MYQHSPLHSARYDYYYPIEILDSCTIRGNGASIVYLELSFLSECVEKLPPLDDELLKQYAQMQPSLDTNNDRRDTNFDPAIQNELIDSTNQSINQFPQTNIHVSLFILNVQYNIVSFFYLRHSIWMDSIFAEH